MSSGNLAIRSNGCVSIPLLQKRPYTAAPFPSCRNVVITSDDVRRDGTREADINVPLSRVATRLGFNWLGGDGLGANVHVGRAR